MGMPRSSLSAINLFQKELNLQKLPFKVTFYALLELISVFSKKEKNLEINGSN